MRLILVLLILCATPALAEDRNVCPDWLGGLLLFSAWPTATYLGCDLDRTEYAEDGERIIYIKLTAQSAMPMEGEIWVRLAVTVKDGKLGDIRWKDSNALWSVPGKTMSAFVPPEAAREGLMGFVNGLLP